MWVDTAVSVEGFCPRCARAQARLFALYLQTRAQTLNNNNYVYHERKSQEIPCKAQL